MWETGTQKTDRKNSEVLQKLKCHPRKHSASNTGAKQVSCPQTGRSVLMDLFLGHEITLIPCRENWQASHVAKSVKRDRRHLGGSVRPAPGPAPCTGPTQGEGQGRGTFRGHGDLHLQSTAQRAWEVPTFKLHGLLKRSLHADTRGSFAESV